MMSTKKRINKNSGYLIAVLALVLIFALTASQHHLIAAPKTGTGVGDKAPDFSLFDMNGATVKLSDVVSKNKVTLINFWGIWCPYCVREIPELVEFYNQYSQQKVELLGIDVGDNPGDVPAFVRKNQMKFPILLDQGQSVSNIYHVSGFPTTVILNRNGKIADVIVGATNLDTLAKRVDIVLKEK